MSTRNLTDAFVLMRNNALQTKHIYAEQVSRHIIFKITQLFVNVLNSI